MVIASDTKAEAALGWRDRKKARRRRQILDHAGRLFDETGFDATTMAQIASAAQVSTPTVFNYFGSKENMLSALLFEGATRARHLASGKPRRTGTPFAELLADLLCDITASTMNIAGKRVWRYAESAHIRHTGSEFHHAFAASDRALLRLINDFVAAYACALRSGAPADPRFLGQLFYDCWSARYFDFIKDNTMPLETHTARLRADTRLLVDLLFDPRFAETSPLATATAAEARS